jgi:predicted transcriptional regulator
VPPFSHCNKKHKILGILEQKVMNSLWTSSEALCCSQVQKEVNSGHAYTTIMTVLNRMTDKKILSRSLQGRTYYYQPVDDKSVFAAETLDSLFENLFSSYGELASSSFKKTAEKLGYPL